MPSQTRQLYTQLVRAAQLGVSCLGPARRRQVSRAYSSPVLLCLFLLLAALRSAVAEPTGLSGPRLINIVSAEVIPDGVVTALAQDERGYIWAGGPTGLARFDAYRFQRFALKGAQIRNQQTGFVTTIVPAEAGYLWAGLISYGLAHVNTDTGWTELFQHDPQNRQSLTEGVVRAVVREPGGGIWIGTSGGGLDYLPAHSRQFQHHRAAGGELPSDWIEALLLDRAGDLWVGGRKGLVRKRRDDRHFQALPAELAAHSLLAQETVTLLHQDRSGRIWVGTQSGRLLRLDARSGALEWQADEASDHAGAVNAMTALDAETVWIGRGKGIDVRNLQTGALLKRLKYRRDRPDGLAAADVRGLIRDASGVVFIAMYGGGVQRYVPPLPGISVLVPEGDHPQADISVRSIRQMRNGEVWLGRSEGAVTILDASLRQIGRLQLPRLPNGGDALAMPVTALTQGADGLIWLGSDFGVVQVDAGRRFLRRYDTGAKVRRLMFDHQGVLWIATQDGIQLLSAGATSLTPLMLAQGGPLRGYVDALEQGADGKVWVGGVAGLYWREPAGQTLHKMQSYPDSFAAGYAVKGLLAEGDGLWCETDNGLYRIDRISGQRARYTLMIAAHGVARSMGANLLQDAQQRIWSNRGVYSPVDGRFDEFTRADGVDFGTGWFRSYSRLGDGRMLFGGSQGLLVIDTGRYQPWAYQPPVVISRIVAGDGNTEQAQNQLLQLGATQRRFRAEFAALDYSYPEGHRYRYRLDGYDADWHDADADQRVASYDQLPPGSYTLQVQGSNRKGQWSPVTATLEVTVQPAWWETWWAMAGRLVLLLLALLALLQWRTAQLRRRKQVLEQSVNERTMELQRVSAVLEAKSVALEQASRTDPLTGLHNRRFLSEHIDNDVDQSLRRYAEQERRGQSAGEDADLIFYLLDIDHFKQVNDAYGHAAGDALLQQMRERLQATFRDGDYLIRWGGEEFLIVARATGRSRAPELAERARLAVAREAFVLPDGTRLDKSCSIGYACFPLSREHPRALNWQALVEMADTALYHVKRHGRDGWCGVQSVQQHDAGALAQLVRQDVAQWQARHGVLLAYSADLPQDGLPR